MKKVAVLGGTRYVGRRVVDRLLEGGVEVTLVTRGLTPDPFGDAVIRRTADVASTQALGNALTREDGELFDVVLHQVAYHPSHARTACGDRGKSTTPGRHLDDRGLQLREPS